MTDTSTFLELFEGVIPCIIDGKPVKSSGTYDVLDPHSPSQVLHSVAAATPSLAIAAIESAAAALPAWQKTSAMERREIFIKASHIFKERAQEFAEIEVHETTSPLSWASYAISNTADTALELAGVVTSALRGQIASMPQGKTAYIDRVPYGVVLGIAPWNAPTILGFRAVANAIIGGNTAVLKTSEFSPRTHMVIAEVLAKAGLPKGVLNVVHVAPKDAPLISETMISHDAVQKVNFTGSTAIGSKIAELAGRHLKSCVMELGGKAPVIVLPDADLDLAANNVVFGFTLNQGQICMASNNAIVHSSIYQPFLDALSKALPPQPFARGLYHPRSASRSEELVHDALDKGAKLHGCDSERWPGVSGEGRNMMQPTVINGVKKGMRMYEEEMFSPVLGLIKYETEEEAVEIANSSNYGLSAAIWSKDHGKALRLARQIQSGAVHINGPTIYDAGQIPHGGMKKSGWGRFNGVEGILEFTQAKVITVQEGHLFPV